ncbi:hypothetical protein A2U01_0103291, partial [Trifolium medium]|nr:hypothetical protein [Trifolium medium]
RVEQDGPEEEEASGSEGDTETMG